MNFLNINAVHAKLTEAPDDGIYWSVRMERDGVKVRGTHVARSVSEYVMVPWAEFDKIICSPADVITKTMDKVKAHLMAPHEVSSNSPPVTI